MKNLEKSKNAKKPKKKIVDINIFLEKSNQYFDVKLRLARLPRRVHIFLNFFFRKNREIYTKNGKKIDFFFCKIIVFYHCNLES